MTRATDRERAEREAAALELLQAGAGSAHTAAILADRFSVSLRQARRYVAAAALDLCDPVSPASLDVLQGLVLHRLGLVAGRAMLAGDDATAIRASRAEAAAIAAYRRAIMAPSVRFRLADRRPLPRGEPGEDAMPF